MDQDRLAQTADGFVQTKESRNQESFERAGLMLMFVWFLAAVGAGADQQQRFGIMMAFGAFAVGIVLAAAYGVDYGVRALQDLFGQAPLCCPDKDDALSLRRIRHSMRLM